MRNLMLWIIGILFLTAPAYNCYAFKLMVITEDYIPFNYLDNDKVSGFTTEIVQLLINETRVEIEGNKIHLWPWKRAYQAAIENNNILLFTTTRTPQRENMFKWVGPIYPREQWMFKLASRNEVKVDNLEQAKNYMIAVVPESANHQYFLKNGFKEQINLSLVNSWQSKLKMLLAGRVDLVSYIPIEAAYRLKQLGEDYGKLNKLFLISGEYQYYLAFSKEVPDDLIIQFQKAYDELKKNGLYDQILEKYLK